MTRAGSSHAQARRTSGTLPRAAATLDPLDAELIRHCVHLPSDASHAARGPLGAWQAARRLGIHGTTAKARLAALRASGVMGDVALVPHPALLGRRLFHRSLTFASPAAKQQGLAKALSHPSLFLVRDLVGSEAWAGVYASSPTEAERLGTQLLSLVDGVAERALYEATAPAPGLALTPLDRRILRFLAPHAHESHATVARAVGVSSRTVRRRLARLHRARALALVPDLDLRGVAGALPTILEVRLDPHASPAAVLDAFPGRVHREIAGPDLLLVHHVAPTLGHVQDLAAQAHGIPGVSAVATRFMLGVRVNPGAIVAALTADLS